MKWMKLSIFPWVATLGVAYGDDVHLASGGVIRGIARREGDRMTVETPHGLVGIPVSEVARIDWKRHPLHEFYDKLEGLQSSHDAAKLYDLARWASEEGLDRQRNDVCRRILEIEPEHEGAHCLLGHELRDGRWLDRDEVKAAEGLVKFRGGWRTPAEKKRILAEEERARSERQAREAQRRREAIEKQREASALRPAPQEIIRVGAQPSGPTGYRRPYGGRSYRGASRSLFRSHDAHDLRDYYLRHAHWHRSHRVGSDGH